MRRTKQDLSSLESWQKTYGVELHGVQVRKTAFGSGVLAARDLSRHDEPLMLVPAKAVLSLDYVWKQAEQDLQLKEVLEALGEFAVTARGAILTFLLMQISATSPDMPTRIGAENAWTTYIQYLPDETTLPTFWSEHERKYSEGTSLAPAIQAKLGSLMREFELVQNLTAGISWAAKYWFDKTTGCVTFQDWIGVDAIWRSRALDIPAHGLCMVPMADMANHAHGNRVNSRIDVEHDTSDVRLVCEAAEGISSGQEMMITYGEEKGACEMVFSYGFIDRDMIRAESLFLGLEDPEDDPIFAAKKIAFECAPGCRILHQISSTTVTWIGPYVWLMCINEEDGLELEVVKMADGQKKLQASWKGKELKSVVDLDDALNRDECSELYKLRAYSLIDDRVRLEIKRRQEQLLVRQDEPWWLNRNEKSRAWQICEQLRKLEWAMLNQATEDFNKTIRWLANSTVVQKWFDQGRSMEDEEVDTNYDDSFSNSVKD